MEFYEVLKTVDREEITDRMQQCTTGDVKRALAAPSPDEHDFLALLSPAAKPYLEIMAQKAHEITVRQFGRTILFFTPIYISNYCINHCLYCGFNCRNNIARSQLSMEEIRAEAQAIADTGMGHLLILTGEAPNMATIDYLEEAVLTLKDYFPSLGIEVYPMDTNDYKRLAKAGVDGLTVYQETYNEQLYPVLHPKGPKKDFHYRLSTPERGAQAGMHSVNIGALLGLTQWRCEAFITGLHAMWLQKNYPATDVGISFPRIRPHAGSYQPACIVDDEDMVQIMTASRIFLPRAGITISTREDSKFRENILPLGVTKMSAGVTTAVGGHAQEEERRSEVQFNISDERDLKQMCAVIRQKGLQPVFKDWHHSLQ